MLGGDPRPFPVADLDAYVIMPNHMHGILVIDDHDRMGTGFAKEPDTACRVRRRWDQIPGWNRVAGRQDTACHVLTFWNAPHIS